MNLLLARLIEDHKSMTKVHACLRKEMLAFSNPERQPDIILLLDIMDYLRNYSDAFHHPLEDRVYAQMRLLVTDHLLAEQLDQIELQHAWLHVLARRLEGHFEAISNDQAVPIARLIEDYQRYIEMAEQHIAWENEHLLPAIEHHLPHHQMNQILQEIAAVQDPLFGEQRRDAYERLYRTIVDNRFETDQKTSATHRPEAPQTSSTH